MGRILASLTISNLEDKEKWVVVNFDVIAWFTHNAKLRLIANCRLRDHSRITHYPFTQSLQKLPLPFILWTGGKIGLALEQSIYGFAQLRLVADNSLRV